MILCVQFSHTGLDPSQSTVKCLMDWGTHSLFPWEEGEREHFPGHMGLWRGRASGFLLKKIREAIRMAIREAIRMARRVVQMHSLPGKWLTTMLTVVPPIEQLERQSIRPFPMFLSWHALWRTAREAVLLRPSDHIRVYQFVGQGNNKKRLWTLCSPCWLFLESDQSFGETLHCTIWTSGLILQGSSGIFNLFTKLIYKFCVHWSFPAITLAYGKCCGE